MSLDKGDGGCGVICSFCQLGVGTVLELSRRCSFGSRSFPLYESDIARFMINDINQYEKLRTIYSQPFLIR